MAGKAPKWIVFTGRLADVEGIWKTLHYIDFTTPVGFLNSSLLQNTFYLTFFKLALAFLSVFCSF